jgi:hypothetical protein
MAAFIARVILWFIFAFILFDTFSEFNRLFGLSLNPYWAIVPAALIYGFQEFMIKKWAANERAVPTVKPTNSIIRNIFSVIVCIIVVLIFLGILIVWAGVIYKAIIKA